MSRPEKIPKKLQTPGDLMSSIHAMADTLPEKVLEKEITVRRLARALLRSEHDVDDLVQDLNVMVLERAPNPKALGRWLPSVVRNLAYDQRRAKVRRERKEGQVSHQNLIPSDDEFEQQEAVRAELVERMKRLPRDYRDVLVLQFFRGLSTSQIATELGLSESGVRTRRQQALAKLRGQMDRGNGGRYAWAFPLATYAGLRPQDLTVVPGDNDPTSAIHQASNGASTPALIPALVAMAVLVGISAIAWSGGFQATPDAKEGVDKSPVTIPGDPKPGPVTDPRSPIPEVGAEDSPRGVMAPRLRLMNHQGAIAPNIPFWMEWGQVAPRQGGQLPPDHDVRRNPGGRTDARGGIALGTSPATHGMLWCEVSPGVIAGYRVEDKNAGRDLHLPELQPITVSLTTKAAADWHFGVVPHWPATHKNHTAAERHELFWRSSEALPPSPAPLLVLPDQSTTVTAYILKRVSIRATAAKTAEIQTIPKAGYRLSAYVSGQVVEPKPGKTLVRAPAHIKHRPTGTMPTGRVRILEPGGGTSSISGQFRLFEQKRAVTMLLFDDLRRRARVFTDGEINLRDSQIGNRKTLGPFRVSVITEEGEFFTQEFTLAKSEPVSISFTRGSGRPAQVLQTSQSRRFTQMNKVFVWSDNGHARSPFKGIPSTKSNHVIPALDGRRLFLFQDKPWQHALVIHESGHVAEATFDPVINGASCNWIPVHEKKIDDLVAKAKKHGHDGRAHFGVRIKLPRKTARWEWSPPVRLRRIDPALDPFPSGSWTALVPKDDTKYPHRVEVIDGGHTNPVDVDWDR